MCLVIRRLASHAASRLRLDNVAFNLAYLTPLISYLLFCCRLGRDLRKSVDDQASVNVNEAGLDAEPSNSLSSLFVKSPTVSGVSPAPIKLVHMTSVGLVAMTADSSPSSHSLGLGDCDAEATPDVRSLISSHDERMQGRELELTRPIAILLELPRPLPNYAVGSPFLW